jgi:chemotaxis protein methyltransferase CheR
VPSPPLPLVQGPPGLSRKDFECLANLIQERTGIHLPPAKRTLLESRLGKRVRELGLSFGGYCQRILDQRDPEELIELIDRVTTNKTDFYREPAHFELLQDQILPALHRAGPSRELRVWSAACSTGEEPYTLAMVLAEAATRLPGLRFRVLATDLSTRVLRHAELAQYTEEQVKPLPLGLRRRWLLRSVDDPDVVRVRRTLRNHVELRRLNLLDADYALGRPQDLVFCRNVLIYFSRALQLEVVRRLADVLSPDGYLFLGHSESLPARELSLEQIAPTVYRRRPPGQPQVHRP